MGLTPVEIRHVKLGRSVLGYPRAATEELLEEIASSFEDVWRERADLRDEVEELEGELARHREAEEALRNTLISAERMAEDVRGQARREADVIIADARSRARDITGEAEAERERTHAEIRRLKALEADLRAEYRAFLLIALDRLEGETDESPRPEMAGQAA
ncbi:MAG: DivIVA domain-containing protein [Gaiellales bacterium]